MIKRENGIFTKLLAVFGAVLVISGVFVFQVGSKAEDSTTPGDSELGLTATGNNAEPEDGEGEEPADPAADLETDPALEQNTFKVEYYTAEERLNPDTGEVETTKTLFDRNTYEGPETEKAFSLIDIIPVGEGKFVDWYDAKNNKVYLPGSTEAIVANLKNPTVELVAEFDVERTFHIEYDLNGGEGAMTTGICKSNIKTCDYAIVSEVPTREGFEFKGWQKDNDTSMTYAPGASVRTRSYLLTLKLKAVWAEIRTYTLVFEGNGGNGAPAAQECKSADGFCKFTIPETMPTRSSFEFMNWQKGVEVVMPNTEITVTETSTILIANWNPITVFTLEYIAEDVKDIPEPARCETFMGTCTFVITDKVPEKEGYIFKGWRLEGKEDMLAKAGDQLEVGVDGPLDLKIFAVWSKIYPVLNSGEVFGVGERIMVRTSANYANFKELVIDEEVVPADYFKISEGGATTLIISNAFSQALSAGEHTIKITWEDGEANGIISVNQNEDGTKRFIIIDAAGTTDGMSLMLRPKAGAVSKESTNAIKDTAKDNKDSDFDAVKTLIIAAVAVFVMVYLINKFYIRRKMEFIENFD